MWVVYYWIHGCHKDFLTAVDNWRARQEGNVSRPDAIRRLAEIGLQNV
jgi:hypothetical protein